MRRAKIIAVAFAGFAGLAACGDTVGEQALAGGGTGAAAAALTGGNVGTGALVGAGANIAYCQTNPSACPSLN
ncbi:hypothetical protein GCM10011360_23130 [Primorskyibacter flagellatus]|uniref:Lipoprotein n=1 Tax=Primorskyibacter flagellatus TaxID=1387277 RepID=A0A917EH94_9RHOB|nr:hypothetical protein [Primorskyibacter flagellatus]GGE34641.1 hypothetical protein GCM10011360_23130 [Primorskyibacter flagellatus]